MINRDPPAHLSRHAILAALDEVQPATVPELAAALGTHPITIERHCLELQRAGHIRHCTGGRYMLSTRTTKRTAAD